MPPSPRQELLLSYQIGGNDRSPAQATIVRTDWALLALECNEGAGYNDETCWVDADGALYLNFAKGRTDDSSERATCSTTASRSSTSR